MIGRLVEQQQVRLRHQRPGQQHAAPPSSRQRVHDRIGRKIRRSRISSTRCSSRQPSRSSSSCCSRPSLSRRAACRRPALEVTHLHGRVVIGGHQVLDVPEPLGDDVEHGMIGGERHVLDEPGDFHAGLRPDRPASGGRSPLRICSSVDLPVPFRPITQTRSRGSICSDTSSSRGGVRRRARHD